MRFIDNKVLLVFKFGEKENLEKLQKGQLFCRNANYYSKCEEDQGDTSMGDKYECKNIIRNLTGAYIDEKGNTIVTSNKAVLIEHSEVVNKIPMFCAYGLTLDEVELVDDDDSNATYEVNCKKIFKDTFDKEYWTHALMLPCGQFIEKVEKAAAEKTIDMRYSKVKYYDPDKTLLEKELELEKNFGNIAFWKMKNYKEQNEFRIILMNQCIENDNGAYTLEVGDLTEHSKIFSIEEIKDMKIKFKKKIS